MKLRILKIFTIVLYLSFYFGYLTGLEFTNSILSKFYALNLDQYCYLVLIIPTSIFITFNFIWRSYSKSKFPLLNNGVFQVGRIAKFMGIVLFAAHFYFLNHVHPHDAKLAFFLFLAVISIIGIVKRKNITMGYFERYAYTISSYFSVITFFILTIIIIMIAFRKEALNIVNILDILSDGTSVIFLQYESLMLISTILAPLISLYQNKKAETIGDSLLDDFDMG